MRRVLLALPAVVLVALAAITLTPCLATCGAPDEALTDAVRACPRARELLGDDASPSRFGFACGSTKTEGAYGRASWSLPYSGSHGRGTVSYAAEKRGGTWRLDHASLDAGGETIDLLACARPADLAQKLEQTNADAVTAKFDGKVLRSTHPTIREGASCRGELHRERGSGLAKVTVACGTTTLYDGTGKFSLDVRDPARRDDDRSEYDDAGTTDADRTPGCRLSSSGASGTLTLWDGGAAPYELVVAL